VQTVVREEILIVVSDKSGYVQPRAVVQKYARFFLTWLSKSNQFHSVDAPVEYQILSAMAADRAAIALPAES
jgi:hypothetical protein